MMKIRTAILGYGRSGSTMHAGAIEENDGFDMVAVCDIDLERQKQAAERFGCKIYDDYHRMLESEQLDLVCVITRSDQHCEMACDCLAAGVNVLVTKPWAVNEAEARRIRDQDHAKEIRSTLKDLGTIRVQGKAAEGSKKLFGSITAADIVDAIKSAGGPQLDKRVIDTGKQHIKTLGKHQVQARLHPEVTVDLQLEVVSQ